MAVSLKIDILPNVGVTDLLAIRIGALHACRRPTCHEA